MVWTAGERPLILTTSKKSLLEMLESALRLYPADDRYEVDCYEGDGFISIHQIGKPCIETQMPSPL